MSLKKWANNCNNHRETTVDDEICAPFILLLSIVSRTGAVFCTAFVVA
jgi:hypothetical protein